MSRTSNRLARFSGLALAGARLSHFTSPKLFKPITKAASKPYWVWVSAAGKPAAWLSSG
jgi:hypothetical protein